MECSELEAYEIDLAYGEPTLEDARAHVETCPRCQRRLESIEQMRALARNLIEVPSPRTREAILAAARSRLENHARAATAHDVPRESASGTGGVAGWLSRFASSLLSPQLAMVGVAAFALVVGLSVGAPYLSRSSHLESRESSEPIAAPSAGAIMQDLPAEPVQPSFQPGSTQSAPLEEPATPSVGTRARGSTYVPEVEARTRSSGFRDRARRADSEKPNNSSLAESALTADHAFGGGANGLFDDNQASGRQSEAVRGPATADLDESQGTPGAAIVRFGAGAPAGAPARSAPTSSVTTGSAAVTNTVPARGGEFAGARRTGDQGAAAESVPRQPAAAPSAQPADGLDQRDVRSPTAQRERWLAQARTLRRAGRLDEAMAAYANARRLSPGDEVLLREIAEVEAARRAAGSARPTERPATTAQ